MPVSFIGGVAVYLVVRVMMSHDPGVNVELQFGDNVQVWMHPRNYALRCWEIFTSGMPAPRLTSLFVSVALIAACAFAWNRATRTLRQLVMVAVAINVPLFMLFG